MVKHYIFYHVSNNIQINIRILFIN